MLIIKMKRRTKQKKTKKRKRHIIIHVVSIWGKCYAIFFSNRGGKSIITQLDFSLKSIFLVMSPGDRLKQCQLYAAVKAKLNFCCRLLGFIKGFNGERFLKNL